MSSTIIYQSLISASHNIHYVNRYIKFCQAFSGKHEKVFERHHILPRSLFHQYETETWNLVNLSPRAHFVAHHLLYLACKCEQTKYAFWMMCNAVGPQQRYNPSSSVYEKAKQQFSLLQSQRYSIPEHNPFTYKKTKETIIHRHGGLGNSSETIFKKQKQTMIERYGVDNIFKDESFIRENTERSRKRWADPEYKSKTRQSISNSRKGQPIIKCSCFRCKREIQANNLGNHYKYSHKPL